MEVGRLTFVLSIDPAEGRELSLGEKVVEGAAQKDERRRLSVGRRLYRVVRHDEQYGSHGGVHGQPEQKQHQQKSAAADPGLNVAWSSGGPAGAALVADHLHIVGTEETEQQPHPAEEQQAEAAAAGVVVSAHRRNLGGTAGGTPHRRLVSVLSRGG